MSPQPDVYASVNSPVWTLCSELLFYMLFPLLIGPICRIRPDRLWRWEVGMAAGMLAVALTTIYLIPDSPTSPITPFVYSFNLATIIPICTIILAFAHADNTDRRTAVSRRRARWLGEISFGF